MWIYFATSGEGVLTIDDKKIVRLAHSLSEEGINNALRDLAKEYEKNHPDVKIIIQSIPKRAYLQWVNVQLIGETSPDIFETLNRGDQMWEMLATRYFLPLTNYVNQPNPYNKNNEMAETIWRNTYIDGMQGGYWFHLMDYYSVPLTIDLSRIFYNKDMLKEITGTDAPPENFEEWMSQCDKIKRYSTEEGFQPIPIATANYGGSRLYGFFGRYFPTMTAGMMDEYDRGYTGIPDATFILFGLYKNNFTLKIPRFKAAFELLRELASQFQQGFPSALPSQARFLFLQEKAVMIKGDVRDARIFQENANFEVGVFDFPLPSRGHPKYGQYIEGPIAESPIGRFHFGVTKISKHREIAIDFLRFITSRKNNEYFNKKLVWYPVINGCKPHEFLTEFKPHPEGVYRYPLLWQGGGVKLWWDQNYPRYLTGEISFEGFMEQYEKVWVDVGIRDFVRRDALYDKMTRQGEYSLAVARSKLLFEEAGELKAGKIVGSCDEYQLASEVIHLFYHGISNRKFLWHHIKEENKPNPDN
jgi:raffinose/stachyose/melibiose transport system substrate-binding protein